MPARVRVPGYCAFWQIIVSTELSQDARDHLEEPSDGFRHFDGGDEQFSRIRWVVNRDGPSTALSALPAPVSAAPSLTPAELLLGKWDSVMTGFPRELSSAQRVRPTLLPSVALHSRKLLTWCVTGEDWAARV